MSRYLRALACVAACASLPTFVLASVPSPSGVGAVPTPNLGTDIPSPTPSDIVPPTPDLVVTTTEAAIVPPSPSPGSGMPSPSPAPDFGIGETTTFIRNPTPDVTNGPAPSLVPAPVEIPVTPAVRQTTEGLVTQPAPEVSQYFFCQTAVLCYDCSGTALNSFQQQYVNLRWNDSHCDDENSQYNLNCEWFKYDSGACMTTTTTTLRYTRPVYKDQSVDNSDGDNDNEDSGSSMSTASMTAIIVCLVVAVVGGVTVVAFYAIKKKKEREYAEFQA